MPVIVNFHLELTILQVPKIFQHNFVEILTVITKLAYKELLVWRTIFSTFLIYTVITNFSIFHQKHFQRRHFSSYNSSLLYFMLFLSKSAIELLFYVWLLNFDNPDITNFFYSDLNWAVPKEFVVNVLDSNWNEWCWLTFWDIKRVI